MSQEIVTGIIGFVAAFVISQGWEYIKNSKGRDREELRGELKKNTEAVLALTLALQRAEIELKHLSEKVVVVPELQKDLNLLGAKVRLMEGELKP